MADFKLWFLLRSKYQLVWMTDVDAASNIVMSSIESPYLFVLDPHNHQYYIPEFSLKAPGIAIDNITQFLDEISDSKVQVCLCVFAYYYFTANFSVPKFSLI
jgi:hypothetical protein